MLVRWIAAIVTFAVVVAGGVALAGGVPASGEADPVTFAFQEVADVLALILGVALLVAIAVYLVVERLQTGSVASVTTQFTTRTLILMPVAIALNIILGQTVAAALKIPIYLDSIGTILVGVLAGPLAGAATGFLANLLWAYVIPPPFQYPPAAAFAIVAAVIGLIAGVAGGLGLLRPRIGRPVGQLVIGGVITAAVIGGLAYLGYLGYTAILGPTNLTPTSDNAIFVLLGWVALGLVAVTVVGLFALLIFRRDLTAAYVVVIGMVTGIIAALISAPIAAGVFGGVTGSGTDFLVAAFRQGGADIGAATLGRASSATRSTRSPPSSWCTSSSRPWPGARWPASRKESSCSRRTARRRPIPANWRGRPPERSPASQRGRPGLSRPARPHRVSPAQPPDEGHAGHRDGRGRRRGRGPGRTRDPGGRGRPRPGDCRRCREAAGSHHAAGVGADRGLGGPGEPLLLSGRVDRAAADRSRSRPPPKGSPSHSRSWPGSWRSPAPSPSST